jgi:hypothetical protein
MRTVCRLAIVAVMASLCWTAPTGVAAARPEYAYVTAFVPHLAPQPQPSASLLEVDAAHRPSADQSIGATYQTGFYVGQKGGRIARAKAASSLSPAHKVRFQRVASQLPPGVNGDGHDERMMAIVKEILDMDNPSKDYKGHVDDRKKLCPTCEKITYRADSPLSDDDLKLMRAQHSELSLDHVKLVGQATLDNAALELDHADAMKKALLDKYPARQEGGINGYEEGGQVEKH